MNSIVTGLTFIVVFVGLYCLLSLCGMVFVDASYANILRNTGWIWIYSILIGWWAAIIVAIEVADWLED